ncbi:hypothetical protein UlMin_009789 [Ulmus minor]
MKVVLFFEVGNWEELEDRWEFKGGVGGLKSILVEVDISLAGLFDKIYGKLGLSSDTMDLVLSYSPPLNKKCSPLVLKDDEDVAALLASRSDSTCKIPLGVIVKPTEVCAYEKSSQESSDDTDGSHDGFRDNYFDLPVFRNMERTENDNGASFTQPAEGNPVVDPLLWLTGAASDEPVNVPTTEASDSTFRDRSDLHEGKYFNTKKDLKRKLSDIAMKGNFEFRTRKSNRSLWVIECIDPNCSWRLRASKIVPESTKFVIRKYMGVHCCSLLNRNVNHRQATYVVIGEQVGPQYVGVEKGPGPKGVQTFTRTKLGAQISYYKAWRGRKHAHTLIRGSPEQSFHILPSYFHMLEKLNPGTVTRIEVDGESRFKYLFLAFGVAIRGFRYMRKVVGIDGTFLKGQYRGVLLVATAQDGNGQCYPLAWGIFDSENEDAWTWFLTQLKEVSGDTDELALISDRAPSIKKAISTVFEKTHHGACA